MWLLIQAIDLFNILIIVLDASVKYKIKRHKYHKKYKDKISIGNKMFSTKHIHG